MWLSELCFVKAIHFSFGTAFVGLALSLPLAFGQSIEKAIPIEKTEKPQAPLVAYREAGLTVTVDPATAFSQSIEGGITNSLQQQMRLAVVQSIAPWLSLAYGAGIGFRTQEIQLLRQEDQSSAYLTMLNRPALNWKPREGVEVEAAYEIQQNLSDQLTTDSSGAAILQGKIKVNPKTTLGIGYRNQQNTAPNNAKSSSDSIRLTSEYIIPNSPITLLMNPGYEQVTDINKSESIRAFVENAVIWKVDSTTTLTVGTGFAGGKNNSFSESGYFLLQHVVLPGTAFELRAAILNAERDLAGEGFAITAGSTVALAQALSAGLSVRYKMDENAVVNRPKNETFLSLSINGRF